MPVSGPYGIEAMHMIRKGRVWYVSKENVAAQVRFIHQLFGLVGGRHSL